MTELINSFEKATLSEMYNLTTYWGIINLVSLIIINLYILTAIYYNKITDYYQKYYFLFKEDEDKTLYKDKVNLNPTKKSNKNTYNKTYKIWLLAKLTKKFYKLCDRSSVMLIFSLCVFAIAFMSQFIFVISEGGNDIKNEKKLEEYVLKNGESISYNVVKAVDNSSFDITINTNGKLYDYTVTSDLVTIDSTVSKSTLKAVVLKDVKELEDTVMDYMITEDLGVVVPQSLVIGSDVLTHMVETK